MKDYTIGGLTPSPVNFDYLQGKLSPQACSNFVQLQGGKFVPVPADGSPICGKLFAYKAS